MSTILITGPAATSKTSLVYALLSRLRDAGRTAAYYKPYSATPDGEHRVPRRFRLAKETTMRDSFVGDIGDFGKFGLLRYLCGVTGPRLDNPLRLAVIWYRNESGSADGNRIGYLNVSDSNNQMYRVCDPVLYDTLQRLVGTSLIAKIKRNIGQISNNCILPDNTQYYDVPVPVGKRNDWLRRAFNETYKANLIFFDPDNGLAPKSVKPQHKESPKYIFTDDLKHFAKPRRSFIIYQHLNQRRGTAEERIKSISERLMGELNLARPPQCLWWRRVSDRVYFIIPGTDRHAEILDERLNALIAYSKWGILGNFQRV